MIRHIVTWNFKEGFSEAEKIENARQVKPGWRASKSASRASSPWRST